MVLRSVLLLLACTLALPKSNALLLLPTVPVSARRPHSLSHSCLKARSSTGNQRLSQLRADARKFPDESPPFEFPNDPDYGEVDKFNKGGQATTTHLDWVSFGISWIYLAHFSSFYVQLPGLFGSTGLLPLSDRVANLDLDGGLWALNLIFPANPELGVEIFTALGMFIAAGQIVSGRRLRRGPLGVLTYGLLWMFWHDLVLCGGRFTEYQMDLLLLDAAPFTVLSASNLAPIAATFGYRWLLARLYLGAGAVKLLSCDASWRDLSAVHWHLQSQPLPNFLGAEAYLHLPQGVCSALTAAVLVGEMAAPFLFLAPSLTVSRVAFGLNVLLMAGIAMFGNFGTLQALLVVIGFALLEEDLSSPTTKTTGEGGDSKSRRRQESVETGEKALATTKTDAIISPIQSADRNLPSAVVSGASIVLAAGATYWTASNIGARCLDTLLVDPLVYGLIALGATVASLPLLSPSFVGGRIDGAAFGAALASAAILAGSASTMANGLGVEIPFNGAFDSLNFGAVPYGLFATMTGVDGSRPVAFIEAAQSADGPWLPVPLWYQVNDSSAPLPLCFPHFPRLDWTLWFIPSGETGVWIARFFDGITRNDPAVMGLLNEPEFRRTFPLEPPAIVRVVPRKYELVDPTGRGRTVARWLARDDPKYSKSPVLGTFTRGDLLPAAVESDPLSSWPSVPLLRPLVVDAGRPEYFVWGCLGVAELARRAVQVGGRDDTGQDDERGAPPEEG